MMPGRRTPRAADPHRGDPTAQGARSTGEVLASLVVNTQALISKEVELVRLELKALVGRKIAAVATLLVGALAAGGVLLLGAVTAAIALEEVFDARWMAWGVVTAGTAVVALVLVAIAAGMLGGGWSLRSRRKDATSTQTWLRSLGAELSGDASEPDGREGDGR
jgi:hypothetical protein